MGACEARSRAKEAASTSGLRWGRRQRPGCPGWLQDAGQAQHCMLHRGSRVMEQRWRQQGGGSSGRRLRAAARQLLAYSAALLTGAACRAWR